jgi:SAM-dependent methyltransferase
MEALCLLRDLSPEAPSGGPLSEKGALFWIDLPAEALDRAQPRFSRLGYTTAVDLLESALPSARSRRGEKDQVVRWRGERFRLVRFYEQDPDAMRDQAPDRRTFVLETSDGQVRAIRGYRGDGGTLSRRGLPVYDARLLVNLVYAPGQGRITLDPFAGVGGIILEARSSGHSVVSFDLDPSLRHGCVALGAAHSVADASHLPLRTGTIDAIATEPPYHGEAEQVVARALVEMARVLKVGGRLAIMCADWQVEMLRRLGASLRLEAFLDTPVNRKGTDCAVLAWEKT